jgi:hypothetical protein
MVSVTTSAQTSPNPTTSIKKASSMAATAAVWSRRLMAAPPRSSPAAPGW